MAADHDVESLARDGLQRLGYVAHFAACALLAKVQILRNRRRLFEEHARQRYDLRVRRIIGQRREEIAIELRDPTPTPKRIR